MGHATFSNEYLGFCKLIYRRQSDPNYLVNILLRRLARLNLGAIIITVVVGVFIIVIVRVGIIIIIV